MFPNVKVAVASGLAIEGYSNGDLAESCTEALLALHSTFKSLCFNLKAIAS